jgi:hypothetical protein
MRVVELALPRAAAADERVDLQVQAGPVPRGSEIDITTPGGELIGTISPFAIRAGRPAGTYTFPLPARDIRDGRVTVRLSVRSAGTTPRAPTADEVPNVSLGFTRTAQ